MQNTRLNTLFDRLLAQFELWVQNPWRRTSLLLLSLLLGNFLATAISTIAGQLAEWDIVIALFFTLFAESISWLTYKTQRTRFAVDQVPVRRNIFIELLNAIKLGVIYGLSVEALKIGS